MKADMKLTHSSIVELVIFVPCRPKRLQSRVLSLLSQRERASFWRLGRAREALENPLQN